MSGAVGATTSQDSPLPATSLIFHVLLVRHAESFNNVLAERLQREHGESPYHPNATESLVKAYDAERRVDPELSHLGMRQALSLPLHPHLFDVRWPDLVRAHRLRVITSPMLRTVQTSLPLLRHIDRVHRGLAAAEPERLVEELMADADCALGMSEQALLAAVSPSSLPAQLSLRAAIHPDFCERGGLYAPVRAKDGSLYNQRVLGASRAELEAAYGRSHSAALCKEAGWWNQDAEAEESDAEYFPRVDRAIAFVLHQARLHAAAHHRKEDSADHLLLVSHADFIDSWLTRVLRVGNGGVPRHVFYASNTSVSHVEVRWAGRPEAEVPAGDGKLDLTHFEVRIRCSNSMPRRIPASTPPPDEPAASPKTKDDTRREGGGENSIFGNGHFHVDTVLC